jgi:2'-5' RNA ligase
LSTTKREQPPRCGAWRRGLVPFDVRISGLGAFTSIEPVLYLAIERSQALDALHGALWREMEETRFAREPSMLYAPASWVPHLTFAQRDLTGETLAAVLAAWSSRDLRQEIHIGDLGLFSDESYTPTERVYLSGAGGMVG